MIPIRIVIKAMIAAQVVYGNHFTEYALVFPDCCLRDFKWAKAMINQMNNTVYPSEPIRKSKVLLPANKEINTPPYKAEVHINIAGTGTFFLDKREKIFGTRPSTACVYRTRDEPYNPEFIDDMIANRTTAFMIWSAPESQSFERPLQTDFPSPRLLRSKELS